jgi:hypothetical protein
VIPFLVEDELMSVDAIFSKVKNWAFTPSPTAS